MCDKYQNIISLHVCYGYSTAKNIYPSFPLISHSASVYVMVHSHVYDKYQNLINLLVCYGYSTAKNHLPQLSTHQSFRQRHLASIYVIVHTRVYDTLV